jgi:hypothetical protein
MKQKELMAETLKYIPQDRFVEINEVAEHFPGVYINRIAKAFDKLCAKGNLVGKEETLTVKGHTYSVRYQVKLA